MTPLLPKGDKYITLHNGLTYHAKYDERLGYDVPFGLPIKS